MGAFCRPLTKSIVLTTTIDLWLSDNESSFSTRPVYTLSLSVSHGMHPVVLTHPYLFWVACHPSRIVPTERAWARNTRMGFHSSPYRQTVPSPMTSHFFIVARYRLVMPGSYTCFTFLIFHTFVDIWECVRISCRALFGLFWCGLHLRQASIYDLSLSLEGWALLDHWASL